MKCTYLIHSNKKVPIWSLFESIKIKCFLYTIQNKNRNNQPNSSDVWYKKIQSTIYFFYIGSWIYKTILHRNIFFIFIFLKFSIHVDESLNYHNQKARLQWLIESIGLSLWVISCLYSDKSLIHLFYTEGVLQLMGLI